MGVKFNWQIIAATLVTIGLRLYKTVLDEQGFEDMTDSITESYKEIQPYVHEANQSAGWNFDWDFSEACQFTIYKENQYYGWHYDSAPEPYDDPNNLNIHGKIRKLSVTISLSDESDYEGGDFEFDFRSSEDGSNQPQICKEIRPKGSIVVFPSFVWHRVKPVISGTRHSLVIWNLGWPFR